MKTATAVPAPLGDLHWIAWDRVGGLPDPTRLFSFFCLTIMTGVFYVQQKDNALVQTLLGFYLNPYVLFYFATAVMTVVLALRHRRQQQHPQPPNNTIMLPVYDRWTAEWYWWNAWLFHAVMDASGGSFRVVPVVVHTYDILDGRFPTRHAVPFIIGGVELIVMYPLCLATCYAVIAQSPHRFPLELVTATFQMMGMIMFIATEVYEGQVNIPALDPVGSLVSTLVDDANVDVWTTTYRFNLYHFVYYWFGFWFCNLIWGVVPLIRIRRALLECHRAFVLGQQQQQSQQPSSSRIKHA